MGTEASYEMMMKQKHPDEEIVFIWAVKKLNKQGIWQSRNLMLTTKRLCSLEGHKLKRDIHITKLKGLTKNVKASNAVDFIIHVDGEYDYRLNSNDREVILD